MVVFLGIGLVIGGGILYWWSEYRLPYGPPWRSSILLWIAGLLILGGPLLILLNVQDGVLFPLLIPALFILLCGPLLTMDSSRNARQILTGEDPRKDKQRKSKRKRDEDWAS